MCGGLLCILYFCVIYVFCKESVCVCSLLCILDCCDVCARILSGVCVILMDRDVCVCILSGVHLMQIVCMLFKGCLVLGCIV